MIARYRIDRKPAEGNSLSHKRILVCFPVVGVVAGQKAEGYAVAHKAIGFFDQLKKIAVVLISFVADVEIPEMNPGNSLVHDISFLVFCNQGDAADHKRASQNPPCIDGM